MTSNACGPSEAAATALAQAGVAGPLVNLLCALPAADAESLIPVSPFGLCFQALAVSNLSMLRKRGLSARSRQLSRGQHGRCATSCTSECIASHCNLCKVVLLLRACHPTCLPCRW